MVQLQAGLMDLALKALAINDEKRGFDPHSSLSHRMLKIADKLGKATDAFSNLYGANPRKLMVHTVDDLVNELADVALTAMVALASVDPVRWDGILTRQYELKLKRLIGTIPDSDWNRVT